MKFEELGLPEYIMSGLARQGFTIATDIQAKTIPAIREGKDVVGTSQTGSGKTYAFGIPAIDMIDEDPYVQVLVVCPTRELATQTTEELRKLTEFKEGCKVVPVYGGSSIERQIIALKKVARIVVGTPGRLMDHMRRKTLKLQRVKLVVLDEADEMLDMGFREDIEEILRSTNPQRQTVMFSATMPKAILEITKNYMRDPISIEGDTVGEAQGFIDQFYVSVDRQNKTQALINLIKEKNPSRAIVFCNTKMMVDQLTEALNKGFVSAVGLHGDMRQNERKKAMQAIKLNTCNVLVATDVAARGIDINNVDLVLNYDIPNNNEYYVHRIGRTARAGKTGAAFTFISTKAQLGELDALRRETKNDIVEYICEDTVKFAMPSKPAARRTFGGHSENSGRRGNSAPKTDRAPRSGGEGKPNWKKSAYGKPHTDGDRAPREYGDRAPKADGENAARGENKPYAPRSSDSGKPNWKKSAYGKPHTDGDRAPREYGDRAPKADGENAARGENRTFTPRSGGEGKPNWKKSAYGKPHTDGDRAPREYGDRAPKADGKPRAEGSFAPKKTYGKPFDKKPFKKDFKKTF